MDSSSAAPFLYYSLPPNVGNAAAGHLHYKKQTAKNPEQLRPELINLLSSLMQFNPEGRVLNERMDEFKEAVAQFLKENHKRKLRIQLEPIIFNFCSQTPHLDYEGMIKKLEYLERMQVQKKLEDTQLMDLEYGKLLKLLEKIFYLHQVLNQNTYQETLAHFEKLYLHAHLSKGERVFRIARAFMIGIGSGTFVFSWGPMAILGVLGFLGVVFPPIGITILVSTFALAGVILGTALIWGFAKKYNAEDKAFPGEVRLTVQEITQLARQEAKFKLANECLKKEYQHLLIKVNKVFAVFIPPSLFPEKPEANENSESETSGTPRKYRVWPDALSSFCSTVGSIWGVPTVILTACGISLLTGATFGVGAIVLASAALIIGAAFAYNTYRYENKTKGFYAQHQVMKDVELANLKKQVAHEQKINHQLQLNIAALKLRLDERKNAKKLIAEAEKSEKVQDSRPESTVAKPIHNEWIAEKRLSQTTRKTPSCANEGIFKQEREDQSVFADSRRPSYTTVRA